MGREPYTTIGMDVSDRTTKVCVMAKEHGARRILEETTIPTTKDGLRAYLSGKSADWPVVFETGAHCRWMKREVESLGMKAIVANPSRLRMVTASNTKNDRNDARELARFALADVGLLHPVRLRSERCQQMLRLMKARDMLVKVRTMHVNEQFQSANRRQTSLASQVSGIAPRWPIDNCSHRRPHWWSRNGGVETMAMPQRDDTIETCWSKYSLH